MLKNRKSISIVGVVSLALLAITASSSRAEFKHAVQLSAPKFITAATLADYSIRVQWSNVLNNQGYSVKLYSNTDRLIATSPDQPKSSPTGNSSFTFPYGNATYNLQKNNSYRVTVTTLGSPIPVGSIIYTNSHESEEVRVTTSLTIAINAGNNQSATAGSAVATAPSVIVKDSNNNPVSGVSVTFAVATGGGSLGSPTTVTTNASGIATSPTWTLGATAGSNTLTATATGLTGSPLTFTATGTVGVAADGNYNCSTSGTFTIASHVVTGNTSCTGEAVVPAGVTSIANNAFQYALELYSITIPASVT